MAAFLKIENVGACPAEGFTVLGVSLADTTDRQGVIGQFGSGNKHGVAVLLRNELAPVVFAGTLKLEFGTKPQTVGDGLAEKEFARVVVKYGGTDASGSSRLLSAYLLKDGTKIWIITEAADDNGKREATTILLPEEY